jgi:hypothetical protein
MGSSSSSCSGGNYLVKDNLLDMSWEYMQNHSHWYGDVYVYYNPAVFGLAKHHGIIVSIP